MNSSYQKKYATWSHHQTQLPPSTRIQGRKVLFVPANQFSHSCIVTDARTLQIFSHISPTVLPTPPRMRAIWASRRAKWGIRRAMLRDQAGKNAGLGGRKCQEKCMFRWTICQVLWANRQHLGGQVGNTARMCALNYERGGPDPAYGAQYFPCPSQSNHKRGFLHPPCISGGF